MTTIFPPEIIEHSTETLFVRRKSSVNLIYMAVVLAAAGALAALPFITVPITTQARGIVRSPDENNALQSAVYGEVTEVRIAENSPVRQGDTLLLLNADNIAEQINRNNNKIIENQTFISDIETLLAGSRTFLQTPKYVMERGYFNSTINEQKNAIAYLKKEYEIARQLLEKEVVAQQDFMKTETDYQTALNQRRNLEEQFRNRWAAEKTAYEIEIRELQSAVNQLAVEKTKYVLKAPASGTVIQFAGVQRGSFIAPGQSIGYISSDSNLLVECYVSPADIGYIEENQQVKFQLDAFNYNQWGMAQGKVSEISQDIVAINDNPVFLVRCSLITDFLQLKNGYKGNLKKGMTLTGRFYLTDRTVWQLLFDKVDNWLNPKTISN